MQNRIKELRKERGWSVRALAERLNAGAGTISELENGRTQLNTTWITRLAKVFDVSPEDVVGWGVSSRGFSEDAEAYTGDTSHLKLTDTQYTYIVKSECLNQLGINIGDILLVDMSPEAFKRLQTGNIVVAQAYDGVKATTILRQFLAPNILVTNSSKENAPVINTDTEDVTVKGIVTSAMKNFPGAMRNGN